jgi:hypothetical protein
MRRPITECVSCGKHKEHRGRGLCGGCYWHHWKAETLGQFPLTKPPGTAIPHVDGVTYRQLDFWVRQGYLRPEHGGGSGVARRWSDEELGVLERMARLVQGGVVPAVAARIARGEAELVSL